MDLLKGARGGEQHETWRDWLFLALMPGGSHRGRSWGQPPSGTAESKLGEVGGTHRSAKLDGQSGNKSGKSGTATEPNPAHPPFCFST
jgi:hypothetical protein